MKWEIRLSKAAEADIAEVLAWTLDQFGRRQHEEYRALIRDGLRRLGEDPLDLHSRTRADLHPDARTIHLGQRGKKARHLFVYRMKPSGIIQVSRLLHDAMDIQRHLPDDFDTT